MPWYGLIAACLYCSLIFALFIIPDIIIEKIEEKRKRTITLSKTAPKKKTVEPCWKGCDESLLKEFEEDE
jgi:hypothetical protein